MAGQRGADAAQGCGYSGCRCNGGGIDCGVGVCGCGMGMGEVVVVGRGCWFRVWHVLAVYVCTLLLVVLVVFVCIPVCFVACAVVSVGSACTGRILVR